MIKDKGDILKMPKNMYKIKDLKTGKYSMGGNPPTWGKNGKLWKSERDLNLHFNLIAKNPVYHKSYDDCMVECYELNKIGSIPAFKFVYDAVAKKRLNDIKEKKEREARLKRQRWEQYQKLREEFEE